MAETTKKTCDLIKTLTSQAQSATASKPNLKLYTFCAVGLSAHVSPYSCQMDPKMVETSSVVR